MQHLVFGYCNINLYKLYRGYIAQDEDSTEAASPDQSQSVTDALIQPVLTDNNTDTDVRGSSNNQLAEHHHIEMCTYNQVATIVIII